MKLFVDSAEQDRVGEILATGLCAGVTTNPTVLARAGLPLTDLPAFVAWARGAGASTVFVQVWGRTMEDYLDSAARLAGACGEVVLKVPATSEGLTAARILVDRGHEVLITAVYGVAQVLPATLTGATWIAPYVGRMTAAGHDGVVATRDMQRILTATHSPTRLLAASLHHGEELTALAAAGVEAFTLGPDLWRTLLEEPLTTRAAEEFETSLRTVAALPSAAGEVSGASLSGRPDDAESERAGSADVG